MMIDFFLIKLCQKDHGRGYVLHERAFSTKALIKTHVEMVILIILRIWWQKERDYTADFSIMIILRAVWPYRMQQIYTRSLKDIGMPMLTLIPFERKEFQYGEPYWLDSGL